LKASLKSPRKRTSPVSRRYRHQDRVNANTLRLRALMALFRLTASEVAKATGFSRCYVSRLLSHNDDFTGSPEFYRTLECKMGQIIDSRTSQYFTVPAVSAQRARNVLEQVPLDQAADGSEMARAA